MSTWFRLIVLTALVAGTRPDILRAQRATDGVTVSGIVLVDSLERPIAGAEVELVGTPYRTRSDSAGAFSLRSVPVGAYRLQLRAVGYAPLVLDVQLTAEGLEGVEALLRPVAQELERVRIRASLTPTARHLIDFENRRKVGIGKFLDSTRLWAYGGPREWATAIVAEVPGVRSMGYGSSKALATGSRGPTSFRNLPNGDVMDARRGARGACYMRVFVDGMLRYNSRAGETLFDVTNFDGPPIVAAEVYAPAQLPAEFNRLSDASCGAILLWTKR
ncbi:MAG: carboxypeptidase-like regulatory domain-containing protein [Gemmatimonadaceae bacterium]|nr:carboxypeptidase-like regulatory domain-containing protein [Gemmatimonadaceae bacterium]